jgi:hypothetical protein
MSLETKLYIALKNHLRNTGWHLIAGQPPSGTDHLPVLEIKSQVGDERGSRDSYKPDLVAVSLNQLLIVEIKPSYSANDDAKLIRTLTVENRIASLWSEVENRSLKDAAGNKIAERKAEFELRAALAYAGEFWPVESLWSFVHNGHSFELHAPISVVGD